MIFHVTNSCTIQLTHREMPQLPTLQRICIDFIANDDTIESFDNLQVPPELAFNILKKKLHKAEPSNNIIRKSHINGLIKPGLKHFKIFEFKKLIENEEIIEEILLKLSEYLMTFVIYAKSCSWESFNVVIPKLKHARKISVNFYNDFPYDNLVFALKNCNNLKSLSFAKTYAKLKDDTMDFILEHFKSLNYLGVDENCICKAISRKTRIYPNFKTSLNHITLVTCRYDHPQETLNHLVSSMSPIKSIDIYLNGLRFEDLDFSCLNESGPHIESIEMHNVDYDSQFAPIIEKHGPMVTNVTLDSNNIDMNHLIRHCPNLMSTHLMGHLTSETCIKPMKNLKKLALSVHVPDSEEFWISLLEGCESIDDLYIHNINDGRPLQRAFKKIYEKHNFPKLKCFELSQVSNVTMNDLIPVLEYSAIPLKYVHITFCRDIKRSDFEAFKNRVGFGIDNCTYTDQQG